MTNDYLVPFVVTIVAASLFCTYTLLDPADWLARLMQLTPMPGEFKMFILVLALGGLACAWVAERRVFPSLARQIANLHTLIRPRYRKRRKEYKLVLADMRI